MRRIGRASPPDARLRQRAAERLAFALLNGAEAPHPDQLRLPIA